MSYGRRKVPSELTEGYRQEWRSGSNSVDGGVPTELSVHDQESSTDSDQKESPTADGEVSILSEMTIIPPDSSKRRHQRRRPADRIDGTPPTVLLELPATVVAPDAPTDVTVTEQLLLDTGFHPSTARAFSSFDYEAVRGELHTQDLLGWLPRGDRDRRIGMLVMRWRRVRPEVEGRQQSADATESSDHRPLTTDHQSSHETGATRYAVREDVHAPVQDGPESLEQCEEEPLDPWTERARQLRPQWTSAQQDALARALRHAPNDGSSPGDGSGRLGGGTAVLREGSRWGGGQLAHLLARPLPLAVLGRSWSGDPWLVAPIHENTLSPTEETV